MTVRAATSTVSATSATGRLAAELIRRQYAQWFGARPDIAYRRFLVLPDRAQRVAATVGIHRASDGPAFCEHYLDLPVQEAVSAGTGHSVGRDAIVELGNLAAASRRYWMPLMRGAREWCLADGCDWIVFCLTRDLAALLRRLDIATHPLAPALPARVPGGTRIWGTYYDRLPWVYAADVHQSNRLSG